MNDARLLQASFSSKRIAAKTTQDKWQRGLAHFFLLRLLTAMVGWDWERSAEPTRLTVAFGCKLIIPNGVE